MALVIHPITQICLLFLLYERQTGCYINNSVYLNFMASEITEAVRTEVAIYMFAC